MFRTGAISASVFVNKVDGEGGKRTVRNVNLQRRFKDGDEWKSTSSFGLSDLPAAIAVLKLALDHVAEQKAVIQP